MNVMTIQDFENLLYQTERMKKTEFSPDEETLDNLVAFLNQERRKESDCILSFRLGFAAGFYATGRKARDFNELSDLISGVIPVPEELITKREDLRSDLDDVTAEIEWWYMEQAYNIGVHTDRKE